MALTTKFDPRISTAGVDLDSTSSTTEASTAAPATPAVVPPPAPAPVIWGTQTKAASTPWGAVGDAGSGDEAGPKAWGPKSVAAAPPSYDVDTFTAMPLDAKKAELSKLQAKKTAIEGRIANRTAQLDERWSGMKVSSKSEALREYHDRSKRLDPVTRQQLNGLVSDAEQSQRKINELRAQADGMCRPAECTAEQTRERRTIAVKIVEQRQSQTAKVQEAQEVVDTKGYKADRLAVTEQLIDPDAPAEGSGFSLLDELADLTSVSELIDWVFDQIKEVQEERRELEEEKQAKLLDERYVEKQVQKKDVLKKLVTKRLEESRAVAAAAKRHADQFDS